jgi:antitoxin YefM
MKDDIVPLAAFRANAAEMMRRVNDEDRPVVITQRGRSVGVVVSPSEYDRFVYEREVVHRVLRGLEAAEAEDLVDDDEAWDTVEAVISNAERRS